MKLSQSILLSLLAVVSTVEAGCSQVSGNYYCDQTEAIVYQNVGYKGSYQDVTNMDESSCQCSQESTSFSGTNSPLDEELSVHFRGPLKLLQFGVYYPGSGSSSNKKRDEESCTTTQHVHHAHKREAATKVVEVTQTVFVDGNGNLVTSTATQEAEATSSAQDQAQDPESATEVIDKKVQSSTSQEQQASSSPSSTTTLQSSSDDSGSGSSASSSSSSPSSSSSSGSGSSSDWERVAYYTPGSTNNVTFMNYKGGSGSGTWSSCFGNSISYADSNGVDGASDATALDETTFKSDEEFMIFSGSSCSDKSKGDCGYTRSKIPAYHGFGGASKIFVFEFEMPHDTSSSGASNPDMPAIWLLNAKIPRTLQYGNSKCSCWSTGCGELDLFEVLTEGQEKLISHLHDGQGNDGSSYGGGGSQDYFKRPTSGSFKGAAVFQDDGSIYVVEVDDDFSSGLSSSTVSGWIKQSASTAQLQG